MTAANFTCNLDTKLFINPCSPLFQCFYDEALGDVDGVSTCHCGTIGRFSNDHFPDCQHDSDMSWLPKVMGIVNVSVCGIIIVWSIWMFVTLHKLQQLQFNDITKALVLTTLAVTFEIVHQSCETIQMFMKDPVNHLTFYGTPGIAQTTLSGMGCCMVLSDLNIPLLWMQIASSGMNKASEPINLVVFIFNSF
ncbi:hypothetical protein TL16_g02252 [Triparma laevis f. inornata]|uniref:Uncharacterized protein n=1 Tax=Triparma laevis f. inornata TaxID=1714386 RepID=A0A9W7DZZ0_9STRA|nr:hypothetical protein TL16_g02252 [Triparma laevis f. inornata]